MPQIENVDFYRKAAPEKLLEKVGEVVSAEVDRSFIFGVDDMLQFPHFDRTEIKTGRVLGRGGFGVIREITALGLVAKPGENGDAKSSGKLARSFFRQGSSSAARSVSSVNEDDLSSRERLARKVWSRKAGKFVIKEVEKDLLHSDRVTFLKGIIDLALEARFLAVLQHPNVLSLRGVSSQDPASDLSYFIILDQLEETLPKRLNAWMQQKRASQGITGALTGGRRKSKDLLMDRILVVYDIAGVMKYLHSRSVIYRDLKPDNIGFAAGSELKLFDFGLAKELQDNSRQDDGLYRLTGFTGAIRYMAPENGLRQPYNLKADVYSWSMLMWYVLALEPPFGSFTPKMIIDRVFRRQYRPAIKEKWPEEITSLMRESWDVNTDARPSFHDIKDRLKAYVSNLDPEVAAFMNTSQNGEQTS